MPSTGSGPVVGRRPLDELVWSVRRLAGAGDLRDLAARRGSGAGDPIGHAGDPWIDRGIVDVGPRDAEAEVAEERDRIARDLHDTVIQRLFAVGLGLQGVLAHLDDPALAQRLRTAVDEIDVAIRDIRTTVLALATGRGEGDLRTRILEVTREASRVLGFAPATRFDGPLETLVPPELAGELLQTLREALSNVARHARASRTTVEIGAADVLTVDVVDDGVGPPSRPRSGGLGLATMHDRAERHGGRFELRTAEGGGTHVHWAVPLRL